MRIYCSYFDHRYLAKGLAMIRSLRRHALAAEVWVLCLSAEAERILMHMNEPGVHVLALRELEQGDEGLAAARADGRNTIEYYFTMTPSLVQYMMDHVPGAEIVTYLDGDMWFIGDPKPLYDAMADDSVLIIPHGFAPAKRRLEKFGIYNVGWVSFRNDARGWACVEWWRQRTNEWCFDRVENGRFCEQGYLDQFPRLFEGVHVLDNRGANLAPWNVGATTVSTRAGALFADDAPILFFHFHGIKSLGHDEYLTAHGFYGAPLTALVRDALYLPYLREVRAIQHEIENRFGVVAQGAVRELHGATGSHLAQLKGRFKLALARLRGLVIQLPA